MKLFGFICLILIINKVIPLFVNEFKIYNQDLEYKNKIILLKSNG